MGRQRCKSCLALLGVCLISCRAQSDAHDHSAELSDTTLGQPSQESSSDFTSWLGQESPAVHVQHMYQESGSSDTVFAWMLDASRGGCGAMVEGVSLDAAHAHDPDGDDAAVDEASGAADSDHADHAELDGHAGHAHRRMLDHGGHEHDEEEDDAHDHAAESGADVASSMRVLSVESLDALNASAESGEAAVRDALAYITACLVDPSCVLEGGSIMPAEDDHDDHGGHSNSDASKHIGLKLALAAAFLVMTVATSYLPLVFMWSSNYYGILTCLNVFSGSVFLSVGLMHLLPHVADYEEAAALTSNYPVGNAFVILGFLLVLFMEQVVFDVHGSEVKERDAEAKASAKYTLMTRATTLAQRYHSPLLTEGAVVLHAVLECIVLGLSGSREDIWLLFAAICSHKVFTTMSQSARFLRLGCPPGLLFVLLLPFHILPPLGVVIGAVTGRENATVSLVLAGLATGTFLYVGAFEVVAEEFADAGHGAPGTAASANGTTACFRSAGSGCIGAPVTEDDMDGSDSTAGADPKAWIPGRLLKFVIFVSGCGMLLAVTAALPAHSEIHDH